MEGILRRFATSTNKNFVFIYFLYDGETITEENYNIIFDEFANNIDKGASTI